MRKIFDRHVLYAGFLFVFAWTIGANLNAASVDEKARKIYQATGVQGGLVVHVGCGQSRLTAALHQNEGYLVHGLDRDAADVQKAREYIRSKGVYGPVSVKQWEEEDTLPYVDNLVNLLIVEKDFGLAERELMRVLAPGGVAYVKQQNGNWRKKTHPWPDEIDEWTHYLHGPDNNAVSDDTRVGLPRHMKWNGGPMWTRNHHKLM